MNRIKILSVHAGLGSGGAESLMANSVFSNIDKSKFQLDFVTHSSEKEMWEDKLLLEGSKIFRINKIKKGNIFSYKKQWILFFKNHPEYKIIHIHFYNMAPFIVPIAKKYGVKTIVHSHTASNKSFIKRQFRYFVRSGCDRKLACGVDAGEFVFGRNSCYSVVNNGIELSTYTYNQETRIKKRTELGIVENKFVIATIGRITYQKNPDFIVEIIEKYSKINDDFLFIWIGINYHEKYEQIIKDKGLSKYVLHFENRTDISELLNCMDIFILPSKFEGLPVSIIESQTSELPTLISNKIDKRVMLVEGLVKQLPIDAGVDIWIEEIEKKRFLSNRRKSEVPEELFAYDIKYIVKELEKIYLSLV